MATWFIPALKAVLPHIGTIISATAPAFTKKGANATADQTDVLQKQIRELQAAASQNATHVKELAEQLQHTVAALEQSAIETKSHYQRAFQFSLAAMIISLGSVIFHLLAP
ncbi:hypothetical protein [Nitrospira sp. M1]